MDALDIRPPAGEAEQRELWLLNHRIFAGELQQHTLRPDGLLVDKFHHKNLYIGAWRRDGAAAGMICCHREEPFSAAGHFGEVITAQVIPGRTAEIRLLAVLPEHRKSTLTVRLGAAMFRLLARLDIERLIISGVAEQRDFYRHIGFREVGAAVLSGAAHFYPMVADLEELLARSETILARYAR